MPARLARDDVDFDAIETCVPAVLRALLVDGGGDSEHRHASIAFVHFDGIDERLAVHGAAWTARALDELVRDVQEAAVANDVTLLASDVDHDGGKLILVSGVPRTFGDDDGRLLRAVDQLRRRRRAIPIRIGVNSGRVFAGAVGPPYRRTFTIMGDAVNLAARLMAKARGGEVVAASAVLASSRARFETTPLEPFFVKGKRRPIDAALVGAFSGTQETRPRGSLPFVGRAAELDQLLDAWRSAVDGDGRAVALEGDVGAGKTRLVEELRQRVLASGGEVRIVQCEPYESATPYFAARLLLHAVVGDERAAAAVVPPEQAPWAPLLGDVFGVRMRETSRTRHLRAEARRTHTASLVADVLAAASPGPATYVFEDVHAIDDASAGVLEALAARASRCRWLVLATRRPPTDESIALEAFERLAVNALDAATTDELIQLATAEQPVRPERAAAIRERSGGIPLFVEELLQFDEAAPLPDSVEAVIALQLDELPVPSRRLLQVASVLGSSFTPALLAEVSGEPTPTVLVGDELVAETDGRLRFRHRLLRDVAYASLPYGRRRELHGVAADALAAAAATPHDGAEARSLHCFEAGRFETCVSLAEAAGSRAHRRGAIHEASALFERAVAASRDVRSMRATRRASLWLKYAKTLQLLARYDDAATAYRKAKRMRPTDAVLEAQVARRLSEIAERQGHPRSAVVWAGRGLGALDRASSGNRRWLERERAFLLIRRAGLHYQLGRVAEAERGALAALDVARRADAREAEAQAYELLDLVQIAQGRLDLATHGDSAIAIYRRLRQWDCVGRLQNMLGVIAYYKGDWAKAVRLYDDARRSFEKLGSAVDAALGSSNIAEILADQGRLDEAEAALVEAIRTWRSMAFPLGIARATRYLARVQLRRGDAATALAGFDEARATFQDHGLVGNVHEVDVWRAECHLALGDLGAADALLAEAVAFERSSGATDLGPMIHRLRAVAAAARGRFDDAWAEIDESVQLARERGAAFDVALGLEAMSELASACDRAFAALGIVQLPAMVVPIRRPTRSPGSSPA
jgi:predicted ATPase